MTVKIAHFEKDHDLLSIAGRLCFLISCSANYADSINGCDIPIIVTGGISPPTALAFLCRETRPAVT